MLAWVDHTKNATLPEEIPYKVYKPFRTKGNLNVWTLSRDGKESLSYTPVNHMTLTGAVHQHSTAGMYVAILGSMNKGQLAIFTVE